MRTTVTLDPDVEQLLRERMRRNHRGFKETLNQAVRNGLNPVDEKEEPFHIQPRPMGVKTGVDPARPADMADELEENFFLGIAEETRKYGK